MDASLDRVRETVLDFYAEHGRSMPWRDAPDPYRVLLSEVMLQQTQVSRVLPRYSEWLEEFPSLETLAAAPLEEVLRLWQGLGYNRRALALKRTAEECVERFGGVLPNDRRELLALPGIGPATAAGIRVFAFGEREVYLETNVRTVILHEVFPDREDVHDREIVPVLEELLARAEDPRLWTYALMDYGAHLKRTLPNPSRRSRHHARQSAFEGSRRQKRARLLRAVLAMPGMGAAGLASDLGLESELASEILADLAAEGMLEQRDGRWFVP